MIRLPLIALLATLLAVPSIVAAQDTPQNPAPPLLTPNQPGQPAEPPPQVVLFNQVMQALRAGRIDQAGTDLQAILQRNDKDLTGYMAQILLFQINGSFAQRQSKWLNRQVVDTLVLVPDAESFYAALNYWTDSTCFPVLIDDGWYAPLFARAFNPKQIVRFSVPRGSGTGQTSSGERAGASSPPASSDLKSLIESHNKPFDERDHKTTPPPAGMVVIDPASHTAAAGYALAKGRDQPILIFHSDLKFNQTITVHQLGPINQTLMEAAQKFGVLNLAQWSALTLAAELPLRYTIEKQPGVFACDDLLGRAANGLRLAVCGRLMGDQTQSIYAAMSSLFLQPQNALLFDDYSNRGGPFVEYQQHDAEKILATRYAVTRTAGQDVTAAMFRKLTRTGTGFDMIWLNSSGGAFSMDLRGGAGRPDDMPLGHASIIHTIHSGSASSPENPDTLAGRAMIGGCYWYFGSISEPYLTAFTEPTFLAERALTHNPLAFAARQILPPHPMYKPWKLMVFGDPLCTLRLKPAERITSVSTLPPHYLPITPPHAAAPSTVNADTKLFRAATLFRPDLADTMATALLAKPQLLDPSDLAAAMWLCDLAGRSKLVADVPIDLATKHPVAKALLIRNAASEADRLIRSDDPVAAEQYLAVSFQLAPYRETVEGLIKPYLAAMSKKRLDEQATKFLTEQKASPNTTGPAKEALTQALKPPAPPAPPQAKQPAKP
ncbi:MAG: hypothetical protein ACYC26_15305 [Phycisphaerales bacterium]